MSLRPCPASAAESGNCLGTHSLAVYLFIVKPCNAYKARVEAGEGRPAAEPEDVVLLREIRDTPSKS